MSDNKKITDGRGRDRDGIIDAEFVEIGNASWADHHDNGESGRFRQKSDSWWARQHLVIQCLLVLGGFVFAAALLEIVARPEARTDQISATPTVSAQEGEGDYPLPIECAAEPEAQQGVCVQELVKSKTSTLSDRLLSKMDAATKDGAIELMTDAKIWNDNVDTVCSEQSRQRDPSADNAEKRQYYACLNTFLDRKMKEFK